MSPQHATPEEQARFLIYQAGLPAAAFPLVLRLLRAEVLVTELDVANGRITALGDRITELEKRLRVAEKVLPALPAEVVATGPGAKTGKISTTA